MHAKIENGNLIITIPCKPQPTPSKSGKTLVVASTLGNVKSTALVSGKPLTIGLNAYIGR